MIKVGTAYLPFVRVVRYLLDDCTDALRDAVVEDDQFAQFVADRVVGEDTYTGKLYQATVELISETLHRLDDRGLVYECQSGQHGLRTAVHA